MSQWRESNWALVVVVPITVLALFVTPFLLAWTSLRSRRISFAGGGLLLGREQIDAAQVEHVLVRAYWPAPTFVLKVRGRRAVDVIPPSDAELYSWIALQKICLLIKGPAEWAFRRRAGQFAKTGAQGFLK